MRLPSISILLFLALALPSSSSADFALFPALSGVVREDASSSTVSFLSGRSLLVDAGTLAPDQVDRAFLAFDLRPFLPSLLAMPSPRLLLDGVSIPIDPSGSLSPGGVTVSFGPVAVLSSSLSPASGPFPGPGSAADALFRLLSGPFSADVSSSSPFVAAEIPVSAIGPDGFLIVGFSGTPDPGSPSELAAFVGNEFLEVSVVPEPVSFSLLGLGFFSLLAFRSLSLFPRAGA